MNGESRTKNAFKNIWISLVLYVISYIVVFVSRTIFIKILGNQYLSISGLFTNVITLLSFTELGIGTACVYSLYKPIAEKDYAKIKTILRYLGKIYKIIFLITIIFGMGLIPFLPYFVQMEEVNFSKSFLSVVFSLFVVNTAVSYLFIENKLFLIANQKTYVTNIIQQIIHILQLVIQCVYLLLTKSYIGFLVIQILCTILTNIAITIYVKRNVKELNLYYEQGTFDKNQKNELKKNVGSIFFYKIGAVVLNGTDNIIISSVLSTLLVGIVSNYLLVINAINSVIMQCFNSIAASIGNHVVSTNKEEQIDVFKQLDLLCTIVFTFCSVCLAVLLNPLILLWLGEKYLLDRNTILALVLSFYVTGVNQIPSLYRTSFGLFREARFFPFVASGVNVVLSIILAKVMGLAGVFLATIIVRITCFTVVDIYCVFQKGFGFSSKQYYTDYLFRIIVLLISFLISNFIIGKINILGIFGLILKTFICAMIVSITIILGYCWNNSFKKLLDKGKRIIKRRA